MIVRCDIFDFNEISWFIIDNENEVRIVKVTQGIKNMDNVMLYKNYRKIGCDVY